MSVSDRFAGLCRDCAHWAHNPGERWGLCVYAEHHEMHLSRPKLYTNAKREPRMLSSHGASPNTMAYTTDDFGCVQFSRRAEDVA